MEIDVTLTAQVRREAGKGPAGRLRRQGLIPAIFYGRRQTPVPLTLDSKKFKAAAFAASGARSLFRLKIEGDGQEEEKVVMLKDHQVDPLKQIILHVDLMEVDVNRPIEIEVPLVLKGRPLGVDKGGLLQQIRHDLTVSALPQNVPQQIELDVSDLDVGHSIHLAELKLPDGVQVLEDVKSTLVTIIAPKGAAAEEEALGAEEEGQPAGTEGSADES
ncbi:MAG: 50S ribosomal protein L25 [Pseudomonadota bacterium]